MEIEEIAPGDDGLHTYFSVKFPLRRSDGTIYAVAGISADITDRKRAQESAARLAAVVEHSDDAIFSTNLEGSITSWNLGAERLFGYSAAEAIGRSVAVFLPEDRKMEELNILDRIRQNQPIQNYETVRRRKDGTCFDVSLTVSPIRDAGGNIIGISKVARDITEKVRAKEKLEHTVAERTASLSEAIAQMEEFSYSVAHDLRSPVRAMKGYASALLEDYGNKLDEQGRDFLGRIIESGSRMDRLITDVLTYSRVARQDIKLQPVDLDRLVREILRQYPEFGAPRSRITVAGKLPVVVGHEPWLSQIISNLVGNAVKFVPPGRTPEVSIRGSIEGRCARVWIEDNGIGIKPEYQHRLFGMFERIHSNDKYEGTGIGLAIVRKATERMGGKVGVESDGAHGSKFWIQLRTPDL